MNIEVKTVYNPFEKEVTFSYWSRLYGEVRLKFKYIVDPNGSKGIIYTLYNATLGRQMEVVSEEKDFLHDISLIAVLFERYIGRSKDFLIETFDVLISDHIEKYKRIIDTDLYTMIGQLFIVMNVLAAKEPGQVVLSIQDTPVRDKDLLRKVPIAYSFQCALAVPQAYSRRNSMQPMPHKDS